MNEFDQMYREVILDHYKNPRGHGLLEHPDAEAEGQNPLCGDEVSIYVAFGDDGDTIDEVKFSGRGCAISQAATSMLTELVKGRSATEVATLPKDAPVEELPSCAVKIVYAGTLAIGVYNLNGEYFALEDRCSHDDGPLCEGDFDCDEAIAVCPRHGANIDIRSGRALTLPAVESVATRSEEHTSELQSHHDLVCRLLLEKK